MWESGGGRRPVQTPASPAPRQGGVVRLVRLSCENDPLMRTLHRMPRRCQPAKKKARRGVRAFSAWTRVSCGDHETRVDQLRMDHPLLAPVEYSRRTRPCIGAAAVSIPVAIAVTLLAILVGLLRVVHAPTAAAAMGHGVATAPDVLAAAARPRCALADLLPAAVAIERVVRFGSPRRVRGHLAPAACAARQAHVLLGLHAKALARAAFAATVHVRPSVPRTRASASSIATSRARGMPRPGSRSSGCSAA